MHAYSVFVNVRSLDSIPYANPILPHTSGLCEYESIESIFPETVVFFHNLLYSHHHFATYGLVLCVPSKISVYVYVCVVYKHIREILLLPIFRIGHNICAAVHLRATIIRKCLFSVRFSHKRRCCTENHCIDEIYKKKWRKFGNLIKRIPKVNIEFKEAKRIVLIVKNWKTQN